MPSFWMHHCFTALSWTNRGMVAVVIWPEQRRGCVTNLMPGCADLIKIIFQRTQGLTSFALCPLAFSRRFRDLRLSVARLHSANNRFKHIRHSVAAASLPVKDDGLGVRRVFARNSRIFGISFKHTLPPGGHSLCRAVPAQMLLTYSHTCRPGLLHLVPFQILCQLDSHSGTVPASKLIASW